MYINRSPRFTSLNPHLLTMLSEKELSPSLDDKLKSDVKNADVYKITITQDLYEEGTLDPVYQAKARLVSAAIQEIGMGKYQVRAIITITTFDTEHRQWYLFIVAGFGWFA